MHVVYEPENLIEAHLLKGLLAQAGIAAHIRGEHLTGAMGELPALGLLAVMVVDEDADAARALIADWHAATPESGGGTGDDGFLRA
ncbi:DUF2007 domain-containing protein [Denitratimonas sp. CY0512]|uniref:putative signal transducing protein n=1 Tax=Denitratimonas sp. CY0512 TaxID=3131940 RepID=UPI0030B513C2